MSHTEAGGEAGEDRDHRTVRQQRESNRGGGTGPQCVKGRRALIWSRLCDL